MRTWLFLLLPLYLSAQDFATLLKETEQSLLLKSKSYQIQAKEALYQAQKSANYPTLDARLDAIYLKDTPTLNLHLPFEGVPSSVPMGTKTNYSGEIALIYPVFSGFAISGLIEKAKLDTLKTKLEYQDTKRRLYLQLASLYANTYTLKHAIDANEEALAATKKSLQKAQGFFQAGLLAPSELENIKAKKYEIQATLQSLKSQKNTLLQNIAYIVNKPVQSIDTLPKLSLPDEKKLIESALHEREDLLALQKLLEMDEKDIQLAKSARLPTLTLIGALKSQGDSLKLNGDGYTNPNKSYVGAEISYKLFDGFATKHKIEAAKAKKMSRLLYYKDYQNRVKTTLQNELTTLRALTLQKEAKAVQLKAQQSYYKLTRGRFANHLASADELSRAIAAYSAAKADLQSIKAKIFAQKAKVLLEASLETFVKTVQK